MKQIFFKRWFAVITVTLMSVFPAMSADSENGMWRKDSKIVVNPKTFAPMLSERMGMVKAPMKDDYEMVTVNIVLKYDKSEHYPYCIFSDWHYYGWMIDSKGFLPDTPYQVEIRKNLKEFVAEFRPSGGGSQEGKYPVYIAMDIENVEEGMTFVFDTSEATERFEFIPLDESGNPLYEDDEFQNAEQMINIFSSTGSLGGYTESVMADYGVDDQPSNMCIYTNPLSEKFGISCAVIATKWFSPDYYLIQFPTVRNAGLYHNDPNLYINHPVKMGISQYEREVLENEENLIWTSCLNMLYYNGYSAEQGFLAKNSSVIVDPVTGEVVESMIADGISLKYYRLCIPEVSMSGADSFELRFKDVLSQPIDDDPYILTFMPSAFPSEGIVRYYPINEVGGDFIDGPYQRTLENTLNPTYFPKINPFLIMDANQLKTIPGNNTPILVSVLPYMEEMGEFPDEYYPELIDNQDLEFAYIGRCLETRMQDRLLADVEHSETDSHHIFTIKNENILIDNKICGKNITELGLVKGHLDFVPPTLQTLQIKDVDGNINDRIESTGSVLEIYAGDFYYYFDFNTYADMLKCRPIKKMTVDYAPNGSKEFKKIELVEDPEKFFLPGSGFFFSSNLDDIVSDCDGGWYDLRVSITDEQGNYQNQLISPAFYVAEGVGVKDVESKEMLSLTDDENTISSTDAGLITVWGTDGVRVLEKYGLSLDTSALPHGIYIATVKTAVGEKMIKIVR
ncbi:MAG: hypothetical protein HDS12_00130 [Bacteroides sp.]|nr:hypothetical protein [Bacteroides sp.]